MVLSLIIVSVSLSCLPHTLWLQASAQHQNQGFHNNMENSERHDTLTDDISLSFLPHYSTHSPNFEKNKIFEPTFPGSSSKYYLLSFLTIIFLRRDLTLPCNP